MIRLLLCWVGFHEWEYDDPTHFGYGAEICKHCGKVKR